GDVMVRVKRFALKPMSAEEAALQMDLLGHEFFVFRDAQSNDVSVVYRRHSGGYGLIEPVAD
ncbi:MAG: putative sigma-54 modulation protein, partial [Abditibacteriota bacterium]|nr:putative sigma-54 modulation protein [Abditibacteriota bacterium]